MLLTWDSICQEYINPFFTTKKKKDNIIKWFVCEVFKACALNSPAKQVSFFSVYVHLHSEENISFLIDAH